jgi:hypothetical protein
MNLFPIIGKFDEDFLIDSWELYDSLKKGPTIGNSDPKKF